MSMQFDTKQLGRLSASFMRAQNCCAAPTPRTLLISARREGIVGLCSIFSDSSVRHHWPEESPIVVVGWEENVPGPSREGRISCLRLSIQCAAKSSSGRRTSRRRKPG